MRSLVLLWMLGCLAGCVVQNAVAPSMPASSAPVPATQSTTLSVVRAAFTGTKQRIDFVTALNADCSSQGPIAGKVTKAAANGAISFEETSDSPTYAQSNPRYMCNTKKVPGMAIFYTSNSGYMGTDTVVVDLIASGGGYRTTTYSIQVK